MIGCQECNYYVEDDCLSFCNHPVIGPNPPGFNTSAANYCRGFESFQFSDEAMDDYFTNDDLEMYL